MHREKTAVADELFKNTSLNNKVILSSLSDVGVYITDYSTGETLVSSVWKDMPDHFRVNSKETEFLQFIHKEDRERVENALRDVFEGKVPEFREIYRICRPDGSYRWIKSLGKIINKTDEGKPKIFIGSDSDISDLKATEKKLRKSIEQERKRSDELETIRQIVSLISSSLDMEETVDTILKEIRRIIPYETGSVQLLQGNKLQVIGAEGFENNQEICRMQFNYPESDSLSTKALQEKKPVRTSDVPRDFPSFTHPGEKIIISSWIGIPLISHGEIIGLMALDGYKHDKFTKHHLELAEIVGIHIAIALENSMLHEKAYKMATEDALTGIGNRHRFQMEGRLLFETAIRTESKLSLAIMDIDRFKDVNDEFGHDVGDQVLIRIAAALSAEVRRIDLLARYGGEEFVLILPGSEEDEAFKRP